MKHVTKTFAVVSTVASSAAFAPLRPNSGVVRRLTAPQSPSSSSGGNASTTNLRLFDKVFEDSGPLGKGITVGKISVALAVSEKERTSRDSIFALLEDQARDGGVSRSYDDDYVDGYGDSHLSRFCHRTCMALLRKSDDWLSACSESEWFRGDDCGKAERRYNQWADVEGSKFEKEYIPDEGGADVGKPTVAVVSLVVEIQGDETNFDRAGYSIADTKAVLTSIASDCRVEGGDCLNAFEAFWTPSDPTEMLTERDMIVDFPELVTF